MGPGDLTSALCELDLPVHPDLIVGLEKADDAGVFRLTPDLAIIQTVDFFSPIVDDPYTFGRIAAANSLSDVYAMGGRPVTAMNIVGFPVKTMPLQVLKDILRGGLDTIREADAVLVGGHSVDDGELKYGLAVTGTVHPDRVVTNTGARHGDALILTKPLGTGIIATALKKNEADHEVVETIIRSMTSLNRAASEAAQEVGIHGCTDVTGFGLLGHAMEMAEGSDVGMEIEADSVVLFENTLAYAIKGMVPGGAKANQSHFGTRVEKPDGLEDAFYNCLWDPQTSGGLLITVSEEKADELLARLKEKGMDTAVRIGRCTPPPCRIKLI